jgi:hypothetical protein
MSLVETQQTANVGRGLALTLREQIKNSRFGERDIASGQMRLQQPNLAGVEPIEATQLVDEVHRDHRCVANDNT